MGYNSDNLCPVCGSPHSDNYEGMIWTCRCCGNCYDNKNVVWEETEPRNAKDLLKETIPIEGWGEKTGLKQALEIHQEYGSEDNMVRLCLITFRQYLRENFND